MLDDAECIELMEEFIAREPALWNEDIGEVTPGSDGRYFQRLMNSTVAALTSSGCVALRKCWPPSTTRSCGGAVDEELDLVFGIRHRVDPV